MIDVGGPRYFACDECPIVSQLETRLALAKEYPQYGEFQFDHCGCDKVEDEFFCCGYCEDAWADKPKDIDYGVRKTGRAYRRKMRRKHLKKHTDRYQFIRLCAPYPNWGYVDDEYVMIGSYIQYPKNSKTKGFLKRMSNKKVRHSKYEMPNGNGYRKIFDYWWTLY